jgi:hypothetical protein
MERDRDAANWSVGAARAAEERCAVHQGAQLIPGDLVNLLDNGLIIDNCSKVSDPYRIIDTQDDTEYWCPRQNF